MIAWQTALICLSALLLAVKGSGWTFEKTCLSLNWPTAYIEQKGPNTPAQCVIVYEDANASPGQIVSACAGSLVDSGSDKFNRDPIPFDNSTASVEDLENFFVLKQTGFYYAADGKQVIPSSGKKVQAVGYLCSIKDDFGCEDGWLRFGSSCYLAVNDSDTFPNAQRVCDSYKAKLPQIRNDEENKFVAMLARINLFQDKLGKDTIWGPLEYRQEMNLWVYANPQPQTENRQKERRVAYMRWWSSAGGTGPMVNKPSSGYTASTIYVKRNDDDRTAYFGYWDTARPDETKPYVCARQMQKI